MLPHCLRTLLMSDFLRFQLSCQPIDLIFVVTKLLTKQLEENAELMSTSSWITLLGFHTPPSHLEELSSRLAVMLLV